MSEGGPRDAPEDQGHARRDRVFGPAALAVVTIALTTWPIAFNLGAYDAVFYQDVFQILVVATVSLTIVLVKPPYEGATLGFVRVALAAPALWFVGAILLFDSLGAAENNSVYALVGLFIAIVSIPTVLRVLIQMFTPELTLLGNPRMLSFAVGIVVLVAMLGFAVGRNNNYFLTCDDFKIAGSDQPPNCATD